MGYGRVLRLAAIGAVVVTTAVFAWSTPGQADSAVASASMVDIHGKQVGTAKFTSSGHDEVKGRLVVTIDNSVTANAADFHGFHIHANDSTANGSGCVTYDAAHTPASSAWFSEVDGHWDVGGHSHGAHTGDLPSVVRQRDGEVVITFVIDKFTANQLPGKALIVHFGADDFGKGAGTSLTNGNAGPRYACGLIVAKGRQGGHDEGHQDGHHG